MEPLAAPCYISRQDQRGRSPRRRPIKKKRTTPMAKAATPATKKVAAPRPKAPAKAAATKAAPARKPVAAKVAKDHPIRDQIAATRDTIKSEASKKAASDRKRTRLNSSH